MTTAPQPSYRLIPSRFPPIGLFDTVATAADLGPVMELAGWTNDRLAMERLARLPPAEWVFGRANASIVMAAFLHAAPGGLRFNGPDLGAWYAAGTIATAAVEVAHHLRREAVTTGAPQMRRQYRAYRASLAGDYRDIRGRQAETPDAYDATSYTASQAWGETIRAAGEAGVVYDSLRHEGGVNVVAYRPNNVLDVVQADHFEITAQASERRIEVRRLAT